MDIFERYGAQRGDAADTSEQSNGSTPLSATDALAALKGRPLESSARDWNSLAMDVNTASLISDAMRAAQRERETREEEKLAVQRELVRLLTAQQTQVATAPEAVAATPQVSTSPTKPIKNVDGRDGDTTVQWWAAKWHGEWAPIERVLGGAVALSEVQEIFDGDRTLMFTPQQLIRAMKDYDPRTVPDLKLPTLSQALKSLYPGFNFAMGNQPDKAHTEALLKRCYTEGALLAYDEELDDKLPANVVPLLSKRA